MIKIRDSSKVWHCDFRTSSGKRVRQSLHTTDKREALQREAALQLKAEGKKPGSEPHGITLKDAFRHALRSRDQWRSAKSLHSIHQVYGMVEEHFGETCSLSSLDEDVLLEYGEQLYDEGLTPSTINKRLSIISVLFDECIKRNKYEGKKPSIERYKVKNGRRRVITPEEKATAISLCNKSSPYEAAMADFIVILADTGLRLSEALKIQPRNVNLEAKSLLVVDTKTGEDRRVPLTDAAVEVLGRRTTAPVFQPLNPSVISHTWRRIRLKMGMEKDREFVLHAFRHTYGSTLANAGVDSFRIQKVMGHKTIQTTEKYVHVADSALDGLADVIQVRDQQRDQQCDQEGTKDPKGSNPNEVTTTQQPDKTDRNQVVTGLLIRRSQVRALVGEPHKPSEISISYTLTSTGGKYGV